MLKSSSYKFIFRQTLPHTTVTRISNKMDSSSENNWYEKLVELNIDLAQSNTATECDLHLQEVCCNTLQEKVNDLNRDISKLEDDYEFKRAKLNNISQMDEMLNENLASLDDLIATKEFCLQIMQENYEHKQKNIRENDKLVSSIVDKFERNYKESKEKFDKCSLAQKYHKLKNAVLERKIRVAMLRKKIEVQKAKNKLRSDIQRKLKQQKIIRFAEVMVKYYSAQKSKSNLNKAENHSEELQMQLKPQEDSSSTGNDTDPNLVKDIHSDTNLTRLNYEKIINFLQFKITDSRPAAQPNISVNQYLQSAILQNNSAPQLPVVQKKNITDGASNNSNYEPTNLHNLSIQKFSDQSASLITDDTVANCTIETTDTNTTSSGKQANVPAVNASAATELSTMDKTEITDETETPENITICQEVQSIDKDITTEQTKIELVDSNMQSQQGVTDELVTDKSDCTSTQRDEQPSMMRPEEIDRNIVDNSVSEEQKQEFNIDTDLLQYKYIDAADILNDNEYEIPTFKAASQQCDSSSSSVISFSVSNADKNSDLIENIPTNAFNLFTPKKDEDKSTEPFQFTFNRPVRKPNSFFNMF